MQLPTSSSSMPPAWPLAPTNTCLVQVAPPRVDELAGGGHAPPGQPRLGEERAQLVAESGQAAQVLRGRPGRGPAQQVRGGGVAAVVEDRMVQVVPAAAGTGGQLVRLVSQGKRASSCSVGEHVPCPTCPPLGGSGPWLLTAPQQSRPSGSASLGPPLQQERGSRWLAEGRPSAASRAQAGHAPSQDATCAADPLRPAPTRDSAHPPASVRM